MEALKTSDGSFTPASRVGNWITGYQRFTRHADERSTALKVCMRAAGSVSNSMKNVGGRLAKTAILLLISLGLYGFSEQFSPLTIFEPQTTGWVLWVSYAKDLIQPFAFYSFALPG